MCGATERRPLLLIRVYVDRQNATSARGSRECRRKSTDLGPDPYAYADIVPARLPKAGLAGEDYFSLVELRGIEPRSYGAESGLLRVQSV